MASMTNMQVGRPPVRVQSIDFEAHVDSVLACRVAPGRLLLGAGSAAGALVPSGHQGRNFGRTQVALEGGGQGTFQAVLARIFEVLRDDVGLPVEDPAKLDRQQVQALFDHLEAAWRHGALGAAELRDYCRVLNQYAAMVGRLDALRGAGFKSAEIRMLLGARVQSASSSKVSKVSELAGGAS